MKIWRFEEEEEEEEEEEDDKDEEGEGEGEDEGEEEGKKHFLHLRPTHKWYCIHIHIFRSWYLSWFNFIVLDTQEYNINFTDLNSSNKFYTKLNWRWILHSSNSIYFLY